MKIAKNKNQKIKILLIIAAVLVLVIIVLLFLFYKGPDTIKPQSPGSSSTPTTKASTTPVTQSSSDQQKQDNIQQSQAEAPSSKASANITITEASASTDKVSVRAYISNIDEDGGQCTAVFTQQGQTTVTQASNSFSDATTTQCGAIDVPLSNFSGKGTWHLRLTYNSSTASGSVTQDVEI